MSNGQRPRPDDARTLAGAFAAAGLLVAATSRPTVDDLDAALPDTTVLKSCDTAAQLVDRVLRETANRLQHSSAATLRAAESRDRRGTQLPDVSLCF